MSSVTGPDREILTPKETAKFLKVSLSWVYKNCEQLGGIHLGGKLRFPSKVDLYKRIFGKEEGKKRREKGKNNTTILKYPNDPHGLYGPDKK